MLSGDLETQRTLENIKYISDLKVGKKKKESGTLLAADVWLKEHGACLIWGQFPPFSC